MDGPAFDVHELPPKRGIPPRFRRNRFATIATLCGLGVAAFAGVQWGLKRQTPFGPSPYAEASREPTADQPAQARKHVPVTVGSDTPSAAPPAAAPTAARPAPVPGASTVGLSREAVYYGSPAQPVAAEPPPPAPAPKAEPAELADAQAEARVGPPPPARAAAARSPAAEPTRPRPTRVSAPAPQPTAPVAPSFDCSRATSPGERQVCRNPQLAALDARMDAAYRRALAGARDPRGLKADQDRWMAVREGAALRDPSMVAPAYERRIDELSRASW